MKVFGELIANHYDNIYRPKADKGKKTNPMNLHPFSFQFYKCNPIQTFECIIKDIDNAPDIEIRTIVSPFEDRSAAMPTIPMPTSLLRAKEWKFLLEKVDFEEQIVPNLLKQVSYDDLLAMPLKQKCIYLPYLNEELRDIIPLREIKSVTQKNDYKR